MVKKTKEKKGLSKTESIDKILLDKESIYDPLGKELFLEDEKLSEERKSIYAKITRELKSTFSLPKFGLKDRTTNVMARIDERTSKILDALVALDLAPSRSAAAAYLISEGILRDKEKYLKILESFETIKKAKQIAQYSFYKSIIEEEEEEEEEGDSESKA